MTGNSTNSTIHVGNNDIDLTGVPSVKEWKLSKSGLVIIPNVVEEIEQEVDTKLANNSKNAQEIEPRKVLIDKGPFEKEPIEVTIRGNGVIEFPENAWNLELSRLFEETDYDKWQKEYKNESWTPTNIFNQKLGKRICLGNYLRDGNGKVITNVSADKGVEMCKKRGLNPATLEAWMIFWALVYGKTGKKFDNYSFYKIREYLLRDNNNKINKNIEETIRELEEVERDFGVELFDRDGEGNIINIYQHIVNYDNKNGGDAAVCGSVRASHVRNTGFGSGLDLYRTRFDSSCAKACRSSGILS